MSAQVTHTDWIYSSPAASIGYGKRQETKEGHLEENPAPNHYWADPTLE